MRVLYRIPVVHDGIILSIPLAWRKPATKHKKIMELGIPCYSCTSVYGKPALNRKITPAKSFTYHFNPSKCRRKTKSELQTPVEVTGRAGSYSASIPTHKVTVHDRQRGVVHEFVVPEVGS